MTPHSLAPWAKKVPEYEATAASLAHNNDGVVASAHLNLEQRVDHLQDRLRGRGRAPLRPLGVVDLGHYHSIRSTL